MILTYSINLNMELFTAFIITIIILSFYSRLTQKCNHKWEKDNQFELLSKRDDLTTTESYDIFKCKICGKKGIRK